MSSTESKHNSSQAEQQSGKPGNSTQPQAPHKPGNRKPLPYDDDTGGPGSMTDTDDPQTPPMDSKY